MFRMLTFFALVTGGMFLMIRVITSMDPEPPIIWAIPLTIAYGIGVIKLFNIWVREEDVWEFCAWTKPRARMRMIRMARENGISGRMKDSEVVNALVPIFMREVENFNRKRQRATRSEDRRAVKEAQELLQLRNQMIITEGLTDENKRGLKDAADKLFTAWDELERASR